MDGLVARIRREHRALEPPAVHLERFAAVCDAFAAGTCSADDLQVGLCAYVDESARRNRALSRAINRTVEPPIADLFTEAVALALHGVSRSAPFAKHDVSVHSERQVKVGKKSLKPDVSLWRGNASFAVVECKANLGYGRKNWHENFQIREAMLRDAGIRSVFLVVATEENWGGFPVSDPRTNTSWFALCPKKTWPAAGKAKGVVALSEKTNSGVLAALVRELERLLASG